MIVRKLIAAAILGGLGLPEAKAADATAMPRKETIVLMHGIADSPIRMKRLEQRFRKQGYDVLNLAYPSTTEPLAALADSVHRAIFERGLYDGRTLHFVTFSMGGLAVHHYLRRHRPESLGRVVMIAPPARGSAIADALHRLPPYRWFYGPAGQELTSGACANGITADYPVGVIAGNRSLSPIGSLMLDGPDDGRVSVADTAVSGMRDHIVLPRSHLLIAFSHDAFEQAHAFLTTGRFQRS